MKIINKNKFVKALIKISKIMSYLLIINVFNKFKIYKLLKIKNQYIMLKNEILNDIYLLFCL